MSIIPTFKCVLVGDCCVGKSEFIRRHLSGEFKQVYDPTLCVEVDPLVFETTTGQIRFNVWDCAGDDRFLGCGEGYYIQADCAIVMFDLTNKQSFNNVGIWLHKVKSVCGIIPIVLVGSHCESQKRCVTHKEISKYQCSGVVYCELSSKILHNLDKPFVGLTHKLLGYDVNFV